MEQLPDYLRRLATELIVEARKLAVGLSHDVNCAAGKMVHDLADALESYAKSESEAVAACATAVT